MDIVDIMVGNRGMHFSILLENGVLMSYESMNDEYEVHAMRMLDVMEWYTSYAVG